MTPESSAYWRKLKILKYPFPDSPRRAWPLSALAELPGAIVTRDASGAVVAVLFRGDHAGEQENDTMYRAAIKSSARNSDVTI